MMCIRHSDCDVCYYDLYCGKQKTAYDLRISVWGPDVCSSDLACTSCWSAVVATGRSRGAASGVKATVTRGAGMLITWSDTPPSSRGPWCTPGSSSPVTRAAPMCRSMVVSLRHLGATACACDFPYGRSEEHTSELQSLMRMSYAVF